MACDWCLMIRVTGEEYYCWQDRLPKVAHTVAGQHRHQTSVPHFEPTDAILRHMQQGFACWVTPSSWMWTAQHYLHRGDMALQHVAGVEQ